MIDGREHSYYQELIPAYALGAADGGERELLETHLRTCEACQALLRDYQQLHEELLYTVPQISARAGLTEELRKRLNRDAIHRSATPREIPFWRRPGLALILAALLLLVITNGYWIGRTVRAERAVTTIAQLTKAPGIALEVSTADSHASGVVYTQAGARVALLCVYDLPTLDATHTYQAWFIRGDERISGGVFQIDGAGYGVLLLQAQEALDNFDGLGITVEPVGGSPAPTTPRVMVGSL